MFKVPKVAIFAQQYAVLCCLASRYCGAVNTQYAYTLCQNDNLVDKTIGLETI